MKVPILLVILFLGLAPAAKAQTPSRTLRPTSAASGEEMYLSYCAGCHGRDGAKSPVNLTRLSKNNRGVFPSARVKETIRGDVDVVAHGPKDMPAWGMLFSYVGGGSKSEVEFRVFNLSEYIRTLQVK